jgi:ATP synthase F1 complex assembly factor 1
MRCASQLRFYSSPIRNFQLPGPKSLDQIIKMNLIEKEDPPAIEQIWNDFHRLTIDVVSYVIPAEQYKLFLARVKECPWFVLPVFKNIGYVNMVVQAQHEYILFTSMREFKERGATASPYLSLSHFTDIARSKGIILMRGEVNTAEINKGEGSELVKFLYEFYLRDDLYRQFVEVFNKQPHNFNFETLMEAVMKLRPPKSKKKATTNPMTTLNLK